MSDNIDFSDSSLKYPCENLSILPSKKLLSEGSVALHKYNQFCLVVISEISSKKLSLDAIYSTVDTPKSRHITQASHFDRIPTLKFMLYVNDLSEYNGAFSLSPGSHHYVRYTFPEPRPPHGDLLYLEKTRLMPDYIKKNFQTISSCTGTVIIFDSECIHLQGIVNNEICCIIRAHYRESTKTEWPFRLFKSLRKNRLISRAFPF